MSELPDMKDLEKLKSRPKMAWELLSEEGRKQVASFAQEYIGFLNAAKTEREAVREILKQAKEQGFQDLSSSSAQASRKFYQLNRGKSIALCSLGKEDIRQGIRIIISHIDSPRLDLKPNPLYEDQELALLRTHYYGGIKKYQWVALPLALHGVVVRSDGSKIEFCLGENPNDPVFTISDLLPHLSGRIMDEKKLKEAIEGEKLTILFGHEPIAGQTEDKERIKLNILSLLHERYGIVEEDFISAEIEAVPAWPARLVGLDRSMVGGYGQDDRICAYASLRAILAQTQTEPPRYSSMVLFMDKEETGSEGNTGAQSCFVELVVSQLLQKTGLEPKEHLVRDLLFRSKALSADVNAALDPNYPDVFEKQNACRLGFGVNLSKYIGSRGKYATNDASAEYIGDIRRLFNEHGVVWQAKELGKVDEGGGGSIAKFLAKYGLEMIDCGPPILSMHSPFEIASTVDLYETFKAYRVFLEKS